MKLSTQIKINAIKLVDKINDIFYYYGPQPLMTVEVSNTEDRLSELELNFYNKIKNSIDPEGRFEYGYEIADAYSYNKWRTIRGDQCLEQWRLIAALALRLATNSSSVNEDEKLLEELIIYGCMLVTVDGRIMRGTSRYYRDVNINYTSSWLEDIYKFDAKNPSGDQLSGIIYGASIIKFLERNKFLNTNFYDKYILDAIIRLYASMRFNEMQLFDVYGNKSKGEFPYFSIKSINGQATSILALTFLVEDENFYKFLIDKYDYDIISQYSEVHLLGWNNWFGATICAMGLVSIHLNIKDSKFLFAAKGLERIAYNTRDWGHAFYSLLSDIAHCRLPDKARVLSWLVSYDTLVVPEPIKKGRTWFFKLYQTAKPKRCRQDSEFLIQREMFFNLPNDEVQGTYPNHAWNLYFNRSDFLTEYWLWKFAIKIYYNNR